VHDGRLYAGVLNPAGVWEYDGRAWRPLGNPEGSEERCDQVHALQVYGGRLHATTWPEGHVVRLEQDETWTDCGRAGDALEINALVSYNGMFYAGSIPRAEVFRFDGMGRWTSVGRFLEPADYAFQDLKEWCRVTSLTVFDGRLFGSLGSCTSSRLDAPADFRGRVYAMEAGKCVTCDRDIGSGRRHVAAVRRGGCLELYLDGRKVAESARFAPELFDLTSSRPLLIGAGPTAHFRGGIQEVRAYNRALTPAEIAVVSRGGPRVENVG
jgi:hypothetical protein